MNEFDFGFDNAFLKQLERLQVAGRAPARGSFAGARRSSYHGSSVEFADFRDYVPGDDFRRVDWNAYGRLDRLFLRLYHAERMTTVTLVLDHSPSMNFGQPSKALMTARLAAILAYVALGRFDRVCVLGLGDGLDHFFRGRAGRQAIPEVWRHIGAVMSTTAGSSDFGALRGLGSFRRQPGMTIVISDFISESDWQGGLRALWSAGQDASIVQVLSPEEYEPTVRGDWAMCDSETGTLVQTSVTSQVLERYASALAVHNRDLRQLCGQIGMGYAQVRSDEQVTDIVVRNLNNAGLLR